MGPVLLAALFVLSIDSVSLGKDRTVPRPRFYRPVVKEAVTGIPGYEPRVSVAAAVDTYCIAAYDFEQFSWQGWTQIDNTAQADTFVRVEDFAGLGGGAHGRLVPIEGTKSIWFGTRSGDSQYLCSWSPMAPGYGNNWDQLLVALFPYPVLVEFSYHLVCDTEEGHDVVRVGWSLNETVILAEYSGVVDTVATHFINDPDGWSEWGAHFFFGFSSDGAVSDEDGLFDTDGAVIIDSITIRYDGILGNYEDFESYEPGETHAGAWEGYPADLFGRYSGLAMNLYDHDPCAVNLSTAIMFFNYSIYPSGEYPGLYNTPFCYESMGLDESCQDEMIVSPRLDLDRYSAGCDEFQDTDIPPGELGNMGGVTLSYSAYIDLPVTNLVFHTWKVRNIEDGCPGRWLENPVIRCYDGNKLWHRFEHDISDFVTSDSIQVALGVVDMCSVWYGIYGDCAGHTPTPWFDNVKVSRFETRGPRWRYQAAELFQDNFPSMDDIESYVRADMAADISTPGCPGIDPGDSVVVTCWAPNAGGLDTLGTGEARVYLHCNVHFLSTDGKPDLFGPSLEGTYGSYVSDDGDWTVLLCGPARTSAGAIAPDKYCVDLNDSLFTRGYVIEYYFKAFGLDGESTTLPEDAGTHPPDPCCTGRYLFEFTCLPLLRAVPDVLYVDDFDGRGTREGRVQAYLDPTFDAITPLGSPMPDRYDVNQPSSMVGNGLGSRARPAHLHIAYEGIFWDSGDLSEGTIISGLEEMDKSDDVGALIAWLDDLDGYTYPDCGAPGGLVIMGDNVASDLNGYADGRVLLNDWCGAALVDQSYYEMTGGYENGGVVNPLVTGRPGTTYDNLEFCLDGGCPVISDFDVIGAAGGGMNALAYPDFDSTPYYAGVLNNRANSHGNCIATAFFGFSFMNIRNAENGTLARNEFYLRTMRSWLSVGGGSPPDITDTEIPTITELAGVYPNPFNPITRLKFSLKKKGHVSLRIYDVSGRLVRVLINEVREAGSYEVVWDGTNDGGRGTASGIYFCRMEAEDYERTLKMVQLR